MIDRIQPTRSNSAGRIALLIALICTSLSVFAAEQDAVSKALDSTATQWSFQFAYQMMPDYYTDDVNGEPRPPGFDDFIQARIGNAQAHGKGGLADAHRFHELF